jgi:sulfofructose kinase
LSTDVLCIGHAAFDITMTVNAHPGPDEKCTANGLFTSGGGPAANASVTVVRLGGSAAFCGYLGLDHPGCSHLDELVREGVVTDLVIRGHHPSPLSVILVKPDGMRTVANYRADTPALRPEQVDFSHSLPRVILTDGHEPKLSLSILELARNRNIPVILDAGSVHEGTTKLVNRAHYLLASERFAADYTGFSDPRLALRALSNLAPTVVITLGKQGLLWSSSEGIGSLPAFSVKAVDTTGAGDIFHGAFALCLARERALLPSLSCASAAAALSCTRHGARGSIPTGRELEEFLRRHGQPGLGPTTC